MSKKKPLVSRLRSARFLMKQWRKALHDSHVELSGPDKGKVTDEAMARDLERFDDADAALGEAIKFWKDA